MCDAGILAEVAEGVIDVNSIVVLKVICGSFEKEKSKKMMWGKKATEVEKEGG